MIGRRFAIVWGVGRERFTAALNQLRYGFHDPDNPIWTTDDFRRARPASELPPEMVAAFTRTQSPLGQAVANQGPLATRKDVE